MKEIRAEGMSYIYLNPAELPSQIASPEWQHTYQISLYMEGHAEHMRLVRAVLTTLWNQDTRIVFYLYWSLSPDLEILDGRVAQGTYSDEDFRSSILTLYQETFCSTCGRRWHTLIVPPPPTYVGVPGLYERKLRMFQILLCPNCGAHLRQLVVHIFGPVQEEPI